MKPLFADEASRIQQFTTLMEPVFHLAPLDLVTDLQTNGFFTAPTGVFGDGAYDGGLFDHSFDVTQVLLNLTKDCGLAWGREESPYIIGMFHDLCKIDQYRHPEIFQIIEKNESEKYNLREVDTTEWEEFVHTLLKGHGEKSVMMLAMYFRLTMEEIMCIRYHMGAAIGEKEWEEYTRAIHFYPNVLWTHQADMIASYMLEK